ncbi:hypothetical protein Ciccas_001203 [Cichlidogyrus casuarinus]|uniref:Uncharacterized protein n=1 Tax=Cichlidogyrus casuarinus TaxID=1844966 RepID=A0ABD2QL69_9PLAT
MLVRVILLVLALVAVLEAAFRASNIRRLQNSCASDTDSTSRCVESRAQGTDEPIVQTPASMTFSLPPPPPPPAPSAYHHYNPHEQGTPQEAFTMLTRMVSQTMRGYNSGSHTGPDWPMSGNAVWTLSVPFLVFHNLPHLFSSKIAP